MPARSVESASVEQEPADAAAAGYPGDVDRVLDDAGVDAASGHRADRGPSDELPVQLGDEPVLRQVRGVPSLPGRHLGLERGVPGGDAVRVDRRHRGPVRGPHGPDGHGRPGGPDGGCEDPAAGVGSSSSQSSYRLPGKTGHASPHPIVTTTSAARTSSSVQVFGNSAEMSTPTSRITATADGLTRSPGSDPPDHATARSSASRRNHPNAI